MEEFPLQTLNKEILGDLVGIAAQGYPYEVGGLIVKYLNGQILIVPCNNAIDARNGQSLDYFMLDALAIAQAEQQGEILATYHSHPMTPPTPSLADLKACTHSNYPMLIINPLTGVVSYTTPQQAEEILTQTTSNMGILGRKFVWGVHDCYGLVRDIYREHLSISLPDFDRGRIFEWDYNDSWDDFTENFTKAGFVSYPVPRNSLSLIQPYDVALMNVGGRYTNPNHCGVLIPNKDIQTLELWHHLYDREAYKSIYGGYWVNCTTLMIRHKDLLNVNI